MTEVTFYLLATHTLAERLRWCCRLCAKVYNLKQRIYIYANDAILIKTLYELLWTFEDVSFIPHVLNSAGQNTDFASIILNHEEEARVSADILLNLNNHVPDWHTEYSRIVEVVDNEEANKKISRDHYRYYREKNYEIKTHKIT